MLHTPELDQRACGWVRRKPAEDVPATIYWNNGSNTAWYAIVAFVPERDMVIAVTSNDGQIKDADAAAWHIVKQCTKLFNQPDADDNAGPE